MASLATHFSAFVLLFPVGLRRLLCSSSLYLKNPSLYRAKPWYLSDEEPKYLRNFDLYSLLVALPIASFSEIFLFLSSGHHHPTYRFAFFHQSVALLLFWFLLLLIVFRDPMHVLDEGFVFVLAAITFLVEYSVIGKGISGLGASMYDMLGGLTLACAFSALYLSVRPWSFFAEFLFSSGLVFKGTWMLQLGLSLYTDTFGLKGCGKMSVWPSGTVDAELKCDLEEDGLRGLALMMFLFVLHAIGVLVMSFVMFGWLARRWNWQSGEAGGPLLLESEHQGVLMRDTSREIELE